MRAALATLAAAAVATALAAGLAAPPGGAARLAGVGGVVARGIARGVAAGGVRGVAAAVAVGAGLARVVVPSTGLPAAGTAVVIGGSARGIPRACCRRGNGCGSGRRSNEGIVGVRTRVASGASGEERGGAGARASDRAPRAKEGLRTVAAVGREKKETGRRADGRVAGRLAHLILARAPC